MFFITVILSLLLATTSTAHMVPGLPGYRTMWSDSFDGRAGSLPDTSKWNIEQWYQNLNGDYQEYKASQQNLHLTGNGILRIIPKRDSSAEKGWSSGRLESKYTFTPAPNTKTVVQGYIRLGNAPASRKQGIWPAFWLLGDSHRTGGPIWPACGEIDIMEHVNGETQSHAAVHCDKAPGGICGEKTGIANSVDLPDAGTNWHTYKVVIDRTPVNWAEESLNFYVDGTHFHQLKGARINDPEVWKTIAHNKMFFLLNVAVGGEWPQPPNEATADGAASGMEVGYVAHYVLEGAGSGADSQSGYEDDGYYSPDAPAVPEQPAQPPGQDPPEDPTYLDDLDYPNPGVPDQPAQPPVQDPYYPEDLDESDNPGYPSSDYPEAHDHPTDGYNHDTVYDRSPSSKNSYHDDNDNDYYDDCDVCAKIRKQDRYKDRYTGPGLLDWYCFDREPPV